MKVMLFERSFLGVNLILVGEVFYKYVLKLLIEIDNVKVVLEVF